MLKEPLYALRSGGDGNKRLLLEEMREKHQVDHTAVVGCLWRGLHSLLLVLPAP